MAISTLTGILDALDPLHADIRLDAVGIGVEVLLPAYLVEQLTSRIGESLTLRTRVVLESSNQGATFVPRLIGFESSEARAVFEHLTSVRGLGMRKGLKAMVHPPQVIAAAIESEDLKTLQTMPGVGKRLAETMVAELRGKLALLAGDAVIGSSAPVRRSSMRSKPAGFIEAVDAMVALGETRTEAERLVELAAERTGSGDDVGILLEAAIAIRVPARS